MLISIESRIAIKEIHARYGKDGKIKIGTLSLLQRENLERKNIIKAKKGRDAKGIYWSPKNSTRRR